MAAALGSVQASQPQPVLASIWQRNLPVIRKRLDVLTAAAREATHGSLSPTARTEAAEIAHKLAGSLGMFGYSRGTEIAQQLEILLDADGSVSGSRFAELTLQLAEALQL